MKYFFVLGNNPALSAAEIISFFPASADGSFLAGGGDVLAAEIGDDFDAREVIAKLGGTIKIGTIFDFNLLNPPCQGDLSNLLDPPASASLRRDEHYQRDRAKKEHSAGIKRKLVEMIDSVFFNDVSEGKFNFGVSYYGKSGFNSRPLAMELKNRLKEKGSAARWVGGREAALSSVAVWENGLCGARGAEVVLIESGKEILIARTLSVQPFKEQSARDYGRPARDDRSGMLPPKLARIMINLSRARADEILLDPFCGSGTVLGEAALMGFEKLAGTDISSKAISDAKRNFDWLAERNKIKVRGDFVLSGVEDLSRHFKSNSVGAIITEPYLGPPRGKLDLKKIIPELEKLYAEALKQFAKVLKPGGRIVMVWPVFAGARGEKKLFGSSCFSRQTSPQPSPSKGEGDVSQGEEGAELNGFKIINILPENLRSSGLKGMTERGTMVYGREGQRVWREIAVLERET